MINEHVSNGSKETTLSTFGVTVDTMNLVISAGEYYQANQKLVESQGVTIPIPVSDESLNYDIYLTKTGLIVNVRADDECPSEIADLLMTLAWLRVPSNVSTLDAVEVNVVKVVE